MTAHAYETPDPDATEALRPPPDPLSEALGKLPELPGELLTVRAIADAVADRSLGAILALFAIVNCIPGPPGTSFILGLPVVIAAAQLMASQRHRLAAPAHRKRTGPTRKVWQCSGPDTAIADLSQEIPEAALLAALTARWRAADRRGQPAARHHHRAAHSPWQRANRFRVALSGLALSERDGIWLLAGLVVAGMSTLLAGSIVAGAAWAAGS